MSDKKELVDRFTKESAAFRSPTAKSKYKQLRGRRAEELRLWQEWVNGGKKVDDPRLETLLESMDPMISREAKKRIQGLGGRIPATTLKNELRNHAVTALHTYDPSRKAQLSTHVHQNFMRVTDFVAANRNTRRMPRSKVERYQEYQNAVTQFKEETGREPTELELKEILPQWSVKVIGELKRGFAPEVYSGVSHLDDDNASEDVVRGAFLIARSSMTSKEKEFGELFFPSAGKRKSSIKSIAKKLGVPEHKAYRLKASVERKMAPFVKNQ